MDGAERFRERNGRAVRARIKQRFFSFAMRIWRAVSEGAGIYRLKASVAIVGSKAEKASEEGKSRKIACTDEFPSPWLFSGLVWSDMFASVK